LAQAAPHNRWGAGHLFPLACVSNLSNGWAVKDERSATTSTLAMPAKERRTEHADLEGCPGQQQESPHVAHPALSSEGRSQTLDLEDRREERRRHGMLKWQCEQSVPDTGGICWRSRAGHPLKNQSYYTVVPNVNLWNLPAHAGPKTWREWHGPRLRSDAPLMERLDQLDGEQVEWQAKKAFVNTVRVQTLDRLCNQKVVNQQKEMASQWAPHRRARREVHSFYDSVTGELNSMPMKELKKVLTPAVLKADRDAVRNITKRMQVAETWSETWKDLETQRRQDARVDLAHRAAYTDMLMELSGQPVRRNNLSPTRFKGCSEHIEELAQPREPPKACEIDVTRLPEYRGLVHVDHQNALEACFPGTGHVLSEALKDRVTECSRAQWPPPAPPETPLITAKRNRSCTIRQASLPVHPARLVVGGRHTDELLAKHASEQFQECEAPPALQHQRSLLTETLIKDVKHMSQELSPRTNHTSRSLTSGDSLVELAPPLRPMTYPVVVPTVEARMERPSWNPRVGRKTSSAAPRSARTGADRGSTEAASAGSSRWPPVGSRPILLTLSAAHGLPRADRSGHSDPYAVCEIPGKPKSRVKTSVIQDTEEPTWDHECIVHGWRQGDPLLFTVLDWNVVGKHTELATLEFPSEAFFPSGFEGRLSLTEVWSAQKLKTRGFEKLGQKATPTMDVKIVVAECYTGGREADRRVAATDGMARKSVPSLAAVCDELDGFEMQMCPKPHIGNFWKTSCSSARSHSARAPLQGGRPESGSRVPGSAQDDVQNVTT